MRDVGSFFRVLLDCRERDERVALVTLTGLSGAGPRDPGDLVVIGEQGTVFGSFTAGCAEAAIQAEARDAIRAGAARVVRFGAGSPFMDIRLPCGGGIDLLFVPDPPPAVPETVLAALEARQPVALRLPVSGVPSAGVATRSDRTGWDGPDFVCRLEPSPRLVVAGHGAEPAALLRLAAASGLRAFLLSPDPECLAVAGALGIPATELVPGRPFDPPGCDAYTAVVLLFHDHDRELPVLRWAIEREAGFIGAMGSRRTHAERCRRLAELGVPADAVARIVGPVGLIEAARDPETLAVSVLAQVVAERARARRAATRSGLQRSRPAA